ncbi:MAG: hypothetical protein GEU73_14505 [Chloroflexi bacterium]|nr:hypothetical protein [Chloroflexota bacterium]
MLGKHHPGDVPIHRCSWLVEVRTSWEGELNKVYKETEGFSYYDPPKGPGDETILDVFTRMERTLRMLLTRHAGQTSVCVSHGDPIKILRVAYSGKALTPDNVRAPDPGPASMVTFDFWHPDALPVISAVDLGLLQRIVRGESSGGGRQGAARR